MRYSNSFLLLLIITHNTNNPAAARGGDKLKGRLRQTKSFFQPQTAPQPREKWWDFSFALLHNRLLWRNRKYENKIKGGKSKSGGALYYRDCDYDDDYYKDVVEGHGMESMFAGILGNHELAESLSRQYSDDDDVCKVSPDKSKDVIELANSSLLRRLYHRYYSCNDENDVEDKVIKKEDQQKLVANSTLKKIFFKYYQQQIDGASSKLKEKTNVSSKLPSPKDQQGILTQSEQAKFIRLTANLVLKCKAALLNDDLWKVVIDEEKAAKEGHNVLIWRTFYDILSSSTSDKMNTTLEPTIRSEAIMDASPREVFELFQDNSRVHEYNDNCVKLQDIEMIDENTKINWCATANFGPFKARDFVTLVHFSRDNTNGGFFSVAAHVDHPALPPADGYVRSKIQLNATFMHPVKGKPNKTRFIQITRVGDLGAIVDGNAMARKITQQLQERAPIEFNDKFNKALKRRDPLPIKKKRGTSNSDLPFFGKGNIPTWDV